MKKILSILLIGITGVGTLSAQALIAEPADFSPTDSVKFIIDIKQCTNQQLLGHDPEDVYLWTWKPEEAGRPAEWAQGTWGASNPNLKMKYEGDNVWSFKMVPVSFYGVDAATCYAKDFFMLAKAVDGSAQTEDLSIMIEPPATGPKKVLVFPDKAKKDTVYIKMNDAFTVFYDRKLETKPELVGNTEFSVFMEGILDDSVSKVRVSPLGQVGANDKLKMKEVGNGMFRLTFIPEKIFAEAMTAFPGRRIIKMQYKIIKTKIGAPLLSETVEDPVLMPNGFYEVWHLPD